MQHYLCFFKYLLIFALLNLNLTNVFIHDPINRIELIDVYKSSHYLFIHLKFNFEKGHLVLRYLFYLNVIIILVNYLIKFL